MAASMIEVFSYDELLCCNSLFLKTKLCHCLPCTYNADGLSHGLPRLADIESESYHSLYRMKSACPKLSVGPNQSDKSYCIQSIGNLSAVNFLSAGNQKANFLGSF